MLIPLLIGLVAAGVVASESMLQKWYLLSSPIFILGVAVVAMMIQKFLLDRRPGSRNYDGLADLMIHIHSPASPDSPLRWFARGVISFLLAVFGGEVGVEGAAVEFTHAIAMKTRARSARWFEQRRRSDASMTLSAALSAAFGAPFAAVLLPIELGIGGRTLSAVIAALAAFAGTRFLAGFLSLQSLDVSAALYGFKFLGLKEWLGVLIISLVSGIAGTGMIRFIRYTQDSLLDLFQPKSGVLVHDMDLENPFLVMLLQRAVIPL